MGYVVTADREQSFTGRTFIRTVHQGTPISSPFDGDALVYEHRSGADIVCAMANRRFYGYRVEPRDG